MAFWLLFLIDYSWCFLHVHKWRQYCRFLVSKQTLIQVLIHRFTSRWLLPSDVSSPDHVGRLGREKNQPVIFKHEWQHAARVNARCHKSATTLLKALSSAWWHKCDTALPKVCCRSLNFRSHYTTWTRLWSRVNIVITWFNLRVFCALAVLRLWCRSF